MLIVLQSKRSIAVDMQQLDYGLVSGAMGVVLRATKFVGIAPLRFTRVCADSFYVTTSRTAAIISTGFLITLHMIIVSIILYAISVNGKFKLIFYKSIETMITFIIGIALTASKTSLGVFTGLLRMRRLLYIINQLQKIKAHTCSKLYEPTRSSRVVWISLASFAIGSLALHVFNLYLILIFIGDLNCGYIWSSVYFEYGIINFLLIQHVILIFNCCSTTKAFNARLSRHFLNSTRPYRVQLKAERTLLEDFMKLCQITDAVHKFEGVITLLLLIETTVGLLTSMYYVVWVNAKLSDWNYFYSSISTQGLFVIYHSIRIIALIEPCHQWQQEMKRTILVLSRVMCQTSCFRLNHKEWYSFIEHASETAFPSVSPLGIIVFGRPLLGSIVGVVVMFFLISLQLN